MTNNKHTLAVLDRIQHTNYRGRREDLDNDCAFVRSSVLLLENSYESLEVAHKEVIKAFDELNEENAKNLRKIEALQSKQWRDIASAPKDGNAFLAVSEPTEFNDTYRGKNYKDVLTVWFDEQAGFVSSSDFEPVENGCWKLTKWQPLPPV